MTLRRGFLKLSLIMAILVCTDVLLAESNILFERDVMALLSKAGCNSGACHGNLNGKGGFRLSLRGQDASHDYYSITHELGGRRINRVSPDDSLILAKPIAATPHQGGQRFLVDSPEYQVLSAWLRQGMSPPNPSTPNVDRLIVVPDKAVIFSNSDAATTADEPYGAVQLNVVARFSDGSTRDVTRFATYEISNFVASVSIDGRVSANTFGESTVAVRYLNQQVPIPLAFLPDRPFQWSRPQPANLVDGFVFAKQHLLHINPEPICSDTQFMRRAYLDLLGLIPTAEEARRFTNDTNSEKRIQLIDSLLARPEFADHWAQKWCDLLRVEEQFLDTRGVEVFHRWIRNCFLDGLPLNEFAKQIVQAQGSTYENPPTNLYRSLRNPLARGEAVARVFMGVRLQCAKCHNHPFDQWTQDDYYSWAACFAEIDYKIIENKRRDKLNKSQFVGEQIVQRDPTKSVKNARTGDEAAPRLLDNNRQAAQKNSEQPLSSQVADWLAENNSDFAKAQVNRIWFHLLGRGLVDPVDDFRVTNPPSHPELLDALADQLIKSDFDVRSVIRLIMQSKTYQVGTAAHEQTELQLANYASNRVTRLSAEQLLDAQCQFLNAQPTFNGHDTGLRAGQLPGVHKVSWRREKPSRDDRFLSVFGKPERLMTCECERSDETTLKQVFLLISDKVVQERLESPNSRIESMLKSGMPTAEVATCLYWSALSRPPTAVEQRTIHALLDSANGNIEQSKSSLQDIAWALMNSKEFLFRN